MRYLSEAVVVHCKTRVFGLATRAFGHLVLIDQRYFFREAIHRLGRSRLQFELFLLLLFGHGIANLPLAEAVGIAAGMFDGYEWRKKLHLRRS
jgi:hypothetical protein